MAGPVTSYFFWEGSAQILWPIYVCEGIMAIVWIYTLVSGTAGSRYLAYYAWILLVVLCAHCYYI